VAKEVARRRSPVDAVLGRPAAAVVAGFALAVGVGTLLLMLPVATTDGTSAGLVTALFTTVSAVCVTGLVVVDTATFWSEFGELAILVMIQVGGIGIMTLATLLGLLIARRVGLRMQLTAQAETKALGLGDVRRVVVRVLAVSLIIEAATAAILVARFALFYAEPPLRAVYLGVFHAVSAFNNAGFALFTDNMIPFATDPWICLPMGLATILGGVGFPVLFEVGRRLRGRSTRWSLHLRVTVVTYAVLLVVGVAAFLLGEWDNPGTLGPVNVGGKIVIGIFHGIQPRTAGFNSVDVARLDPSTLLITDVLMFIGGGSASTAGGIKLTTFFLLAFAILAELRGEPDVVIGNRRIAESTQRQAITVALLGVGLVAAGTFGLLEATNGVAFEAALFEVTSAFATVGLSTGITPTLSNTGQIILVALMFIGRVGTIAVGSAIALNTQRRLYRYAEERPIVG
jgi:trk system potassium uptake protein TrkH